MQELEAQLSMYRVVEAPPYTLPEETIQRDQQMARKAAENRGDAPASREIDADVERDVDGHDAEEDVNGFLSTAAGKRAAAKRRVSPGTVPRCAARRLTYVGIRSDAGKAVLHRLDPI